VLSLTTHAAPDRSAFDELTVDQLTQLVSKQGNDKVNVDSSEMENTESSTLTEAIGGLSFGDDDLQLSTEDGSVDDDDTHISTDDIHTDEDVTVESIDTADQAKSVPESEPETDAVGQDPVPESESVTVVDSEPEPEDEVNTEKTVIVNEKPEPTPEVVVNPVALPEAEDDAVVEKDLVVIPKPIAAPGAEKSSVERATAPPPVPTSTVNSPKKIYKGTGHTTMIMFSMIVVVVLVVFAVHRYQREILSLCWRRRVSAPEAENPEARPLNIVNLNETGRPNPAKQLSHGSDKVFESVSSQPPIVIDVAEFQPSAYSTANKIQNQSTSSNNA